LWKGGGKKKNLALWAIEKELTPNAYLCLSKVRALKGGRKCSWQDGEARGKEKGE